MTPANELDARSSAPAVVGTAVLRDYPLRLWAEQQEHLDDVLREFQLLRSGQQSGVSDAPRKLIELAEMVTTRFGPLLTAIHEERQAALDRGLDRMDSRVPLVEGTPELLAQVREVLAAVDEFCRAGDLLVLPRPPDQVALSDWSLDELTAQYGGAQPRAWPGPF